MHIKKILLSLFAYSVLAQRKRRKDISPLLIYVPLAHIQSFIQAPLTFIAIEIEAREESGSFWVRLSRNPLQVYNPKLESMTKRTQRNSYSFGKWKFVHKVLFWTSCEKNFTSRTSNQGRILVEDAGVSETKKGLWWIGFNTYCRQLNHTLPFLVCLSSRLPWIYRQRRVYVSKQMRLIVHCHNAYSTVGSRRTVSWRSVSRRMARLEIHLNIRTIQGWKNELRSVWTNAKNICCDDDFFDSIAHFETTPLSLFETNEPLPRPGVSNVRVQDRYQIRYRYVIWRRIEK